MDIDLNGLSAKDLDNLILKARTRLDDAKHEAVKVARQEIASIVMSHGLMLSDIFPQLGPSGVKKEPLPAKYRNPADASQTWSGRGREPGWFKDAIAAGRSAESMLVARGAAPKAHAAPARKQAGKRKQTGKRTKQKR